MGSDLSDEELMANLMAGPRAQGAHEAFAILLARHMERVRAIGWRMLGSAEAADDLAQEVFLRVWRNPAAFDGGKGRFVHWLSRVAANACIDRLRRQQPGQMDDAMLERLGDPAPDPERQAIENERAARVRAAIAQLPKRQRQAIALAHDLGHTNIEIAAVMEISVEAVESLLARGRRKLRQLLRRELAEMTGKGS